MDRMNHVVLSGRVRNVEPKAQALKDVIEDYGVTFELDNVQQADRPDLAVCLPVVVAPGYSCHLVAGWIAEDVDATVIGLLVSRDGEIAIEASFVKPGLGYALKEETTWNQG